MGSRRWILSSSPINGSGCVHDCYISNLPPHQPSSSGHRFFPNGFIAALSATAAVFFLILTYYTILIRRRRADHLSSAHRPPSETDGVDADADYQAAWPAPTIGLSDSTISSIAVKSYIAERGVTADCSVCLGEFRDGELVRLLPACEHAFHVSCIDTWLRAHVNCPLCRANIVVPVDSSEGDSSSSIALPDGIALINDRRVSGDLGEDEARENTVCSLDCGESSVLAGLSDFPGSGLPPECRSNSMDSLLEVFQYDEKEQEHYSDEKKGRQSSIFKEEDCRQKSSKEIGGDSTSGSGRMFFFSRYGKARSSSVLPL